MLQRLKQIIRFDEEIGKDHYQRPLAGRFGQFVEQLDQPGFAARTSFFQQIEKMGSCRTPTASGCPK